MLKLLLLCSAFSGVESCKQGDYDAAQPLLQVAESVVPRDFHHTYWFHRAATEFQLLNKDAAKAAIFKFSESFDKPPRRYQVLIWGMEDNLNTWNTDPLSDIARQMGDVKRRLEIAKGGPITQEKQRQIVKQLEELIKEQEDAQNKAKADAQAKEDAKNGKPKAIPGDGSGQGQPAPDSNIMGGPPGKGQIDEKKLRQVAEEWGNLPPQKRAKVIEDITRDLPLKYKAQIDEYFKNLNRLHRK